MRAIRRLWRTPGFTAAAVITLALGIGANTSVFALVHSMILAAPAAMNLDHVYAMSGLDRSPREPSKPDARPTPSRWQQHLTEDAFHTFAAAPPPPFVAATGVSPAFLIVRRPGRAERVSAEAVTGAYADVFMLHAQAGRLLDTRDDTGADAPVVISDRLWREWFNADRAVIGHATLTLAASFGRSGQSSQPRSVTVVGVMPRSYVGVTFLAADVWLPLRVWREVEARDRAPGFDRALWADVFGRTAPSGSAGDAENAFLHAFVGSTEDRDLALMSARATRAIDIVRFNGPRSAAYVMLGLAALILVAACANVANMLFARGAARAGEIAVRISLGARTWSIFRMILAETVVIAAVASAIGLSLAALALRLTGTASSSALLPRLSGRSPFGSLHTELGIDVTVVLYAMVAGAVAALAVGGITAWRATRVPPLATLAAAGVPAGLTARGRRTRLALVAIQVTAALLLVMSTGLFLGRAIATFDRRVTYDTSGITAARFDVSLMSYTPVQGRAFYARLLDAVGRLPGVTAAALTDGLPGYGYVSPSLFQLVPERRRDVGQLDTARRVTGSYAGVSEGFLDALGVSLLRGRPLRANDVFGAPEVAIVCESAAARLWPGEDPIGKRFMFGSEGVWRTVVGVSSDPMRARQDSPWTCESCVAFVPWDQRYRPDMIVMVRSDAPRRQADALRAAAAAIDSEMPVLEAAPIDDSLVASLRSTRAVAALLASLGVLAVVIAALGIYGVMAFLVSARTREFGIRLALGATRARVIRMVLDDAVHLMLVGLLPGVLIASVGSRVLESRLRDLLPNDIATWVVVPIGLFVIGVLAAYVPAHRASRVNPSIALRDM